MTFTVLSLPRVTGKTIEKASEYKGIGIFFAGEITGNASKVHKHKNP